MPARVRVHNAACLKSGHYSNEQARNKIFRRMRMLLPSGYVSFAGAGELRHAGCAAEHSTFPPNDERERTNCCGSLFFLSFFLHTLIPLVHAPHHGRDSRASKNPDRHSSKQGCRQCRFECTLYGLRRPSKNCSSCGPEIYCIRAYTPSSLPCAQS